jgi:hypothetical protein
MIVVCADLEVGLEVGLEQVARNSLHAVIEGKNVDGWIKEDDKKGRVATVSRVLSTGPSPNRMQLQRVPID